jgi:hypothetical protein
MEKTIDGKIIRQYQIIGTKLTIFDVYEHDTVDSTEKYYGHSTITYICYGQKGTNKLPDDINRLPAYTNERINTVMAWYHKIWNECYELIIKAYPKAVNGKKYSGTIELIEN